MFRRLIVVVALGFAVTGSPGCQQTSSSSDGGLFGGSPFEKGGADAPTGLNDAATVDPFPGATRSRASYVLNAPRKLDLLFMIDNSGSMKAERQNLAANFRAFMRVLSNVEGGLPDLHLGVISSNVGAGPEAIAGCLPLGDKGKLLRAGDCGLVNPADHFIKTDGRSAQNFRGELGDVFACMAALGTSGCAFEHPLQSIRAALASAIDPRLIDPENTGFLRHDAHLGIVILTDEDDCSAEPSSTLFAETSGEQGTSLGCALAGHRCGGQPVTAPPAGGVYERPLSTCEPSSRDDAREFKTKLINVQEFDNYVKALKPQEPEKISVAGVIGWSDAKDAKYQIGTVPGGAGSDVLDLLPICKRETIGVAVPALRIKSFLDGFKPRSSWHSICEQDLSPALREIATLFASRIVNTCVTEPLVDTDSRAPGVQADCQVADRSPDGKAVMVPECGPSAGPPCWRAVATSIETCPSSGFTIEIDRGGEVIPPGNRLDLSCLSCGGVRPDSAYCVRCDMNPNDSRCRSRGGSERAVAPVR